MNVKHKRLTAKDKRKKRKLWARRHERFGTPAKLSLLVAGASLGRLAHGTGLTVAHLSRIFNGKRQPSFRTAGKIAAYLGVSMDALNTVLARDTKDVEREVKQENLKMEDLIEEGREVMKEIEERHGLTTVRGGKR